MGILVATSGKMIQNGIGKATYYVYDTVNIFMYILYTVYLCVWHYLYGGSLPNFIFFRGCCKVLKLKNIGKNGHGTYTSGGTVTD